MLLPTITDFAAHAFDPSRYARLEDDWSVAVGDVVASTQLANQGRDRDVNFIAGAVVAAMTEVCRRPQQPAACQFGGDGAVAAVPPECTQAARVALAALAHWSTTEMAIPLRVGLVPVAELHGAGHDVLAALQDYGNGNVFGQFLGDGVPMAEHWVKSQDRWRIEPVAGELPGLEGLSCRWHPVPPRRGSILCIIVDPLRHGAEGLAALVRLQAEIESIVPTGLAAPLGDGSHLTPGGVPSSHVLDIEARTEAPGRRLRRKLRAVAGSLILRAVHRLGGRVAGVDSHAYRRHLAERTDYHKQSGGPRFVLDVSDAEITRIQAALAEAEARGDITYGVAHSRATTLTCMVGDFAADRHVHFVDGDGLGFWRASVMLKGKRGR
ncbi:MAG TPA: DUF3095 family protein [Magnetospirillum sp.]|nr:DUF3095 family protein [Magnetospirillum sp.]